MEQRDAVAERGLDAVVDLGRRLLGVPVRWWTDDAATAGALGYLAFPVEVAPEAAGVPATRTASESSGGEAPVSSGGEAPVSGAPAGRDAVVGALLRDVAARGLPIAHPDPAFLGAPVGQPGRAVGVLYAVDDAPREWTTADVEALQRLAACVRAPLELSELGTRWESHRLRWELAVDAAGIGSFDWDLTSGRLLWDDRLIQLFGYSLADYTPDISSFWARMHPDDVEQVTRQIDAAVATNGTYGAEYRILLPGGQTRWIAARGRVLADPRGKATRMLGAAYDTTSLRAGRDQAARVLDTMATGFFFVDRDWKVTYLNAEGARLLRRSPGEVLGRDLWTAFPQARRLGLEAASQRALTTGESQSFEANDDELGSFEVRALPDPAGLAVYFLDVTEKRRAQAEAAAALTRLQLIAEAGAQLTSTLDVDEAIGRLAQIVVPRLGDWCIVSLLGPDGLRDVGSWHVDADQRDKVADYVRVRLPALGSASFVAQALRTGRAVRIDDGVVERLRGVMAPGRAWDLLQELAPQTGVVIPLRAAGTTTGLLSVYRGAGRPVMDDAELAAAAEIAARAGMALDNARLYTEQRRLSEELQLGLLTPPPPPPGLDLCYRYTSAAQEAQVGGDWYDAFPAQGGGTIAVIGDVVGHDSRAAAAMGQLRGLLRGIAMGSGAGPAGLLSRLDESMEALQLAATATAVVAHVQVEDGSEGASRGGSDGGSGGGSGGGGVRRAWVRWSNAGHPPPLVLRAGGGVEQLSAGQADLLLGVDPATPREEAVVELAPGDLLLLYTDGLVERRGQPVDDGVALLRRHAAALAGRAPQEVCDGVLAAMLPARPEDDVAVVAVRLQNARLGLRESEYPGQVDLVEGGPAGESVPDGEPTGVDEVLAVSSLTDVGTARRLVARTASGALDVAAQPAGAARLPDEVVSTAVLLTSELVTNALQHGQAPVTLSVRRGPGWMRVAVSDGDPRLPRPVENPPEDAVRGRGLYLVQRLATRWRAEPASSGPGKTVWFELGSAPVEFAPR